MNSEERPEDAARRMAGELIQLQQKYKEAMELWDALELEPGDIVLDAVLVARSQNVDREGTCISLAATDGVDFSRQLGMLHEGIIIMQHTDRD